MYIMYVSLDQCVSISFSSELGPYHTSIYISG